MINAEKIIAIVSPDSAPIKRMVQGAKENGTAIDATQGRRTKAVLVMENGSLVLSALAPETLAGRAGHLINLNQSIVRNADALQIPGRLHLQ